MGSTICWCPSPPSPVCRSYLRKCSSQRSSPVGTRNRLSGRGRCSMAIPNTLPHWGFFPPLTDILVELRKLGRRSSAYSAWRTTPPTNCFERRSQEYDQRTRTDLPLACAKQVFLSDAQTSVPGYKRKFQPPPRHVCLSPNRRHSLADVRFRADCVRFTPESRRGSGRSRASAVDPIRTFERV